MPLLYFSVCQLHLFCADNLLEKHGSGGGGGGVVDTLQQKNHPIIIQVAIFEQKKERRRSDIRAKPLDFWASAGENICAGDLTPPPPPPMKLVQYAYVCGVLGTADMQRSNIPKLFVCVQWIYL